MNFDFSSMDSMTGGNNPFEQKQSYQTDTRFYVLKKDANGGGAAIIRFLPGEVYSNGTFNPVLRVYRYNVQSKTSKRFINEWSPVTIGQKDPIQERWAALWNAGQKDEARRYARSTRYIANIKVVKDPANPENEGKIFLLDMSQSLSDKVRAICYPSQTDIELGTKAKNLFDPINGYDFRLVASVGANGFTEYTKSDAMPEPRQAYANAEEYIKDFNANGHKLSDWQKPEAYKTYDELKDLLDKLDSTSSSQTQSQVQPQVQVQQPQTQGMTIESLSNGTTTATVQTTANVNPAKVADDLDSLIGELTK